MQGASERRGTMLLRGHRAASTDGEYSYPLALVEPQVNLANLSNVRRQKFVSDFSGNSFGKSSLMAMPTFKTLHTRHVGEGLDRRLAHTRVTTRRRQVEEVPNTTTEPPNDDGAPTSETDVPGLNRLPEGTSAPDMSSEPPLEAPDEEPPTTGSEPIAAGGEVIDTTELESEPESGSPQAPSEITKSPLVFPIKTGTPLVPSPTDMPEEILPETETEIPVELHNTVTDAPATIPESSPPQAPSEITKSPLVFPIKTGTPLVPSPTDMPEEIPPGTSETEIPAELPNTVTEAPATTSSAATTTTEPPVVATTTKAPDNLPTDKPLVPAKQKNTTGTKTTSPSCNTLSCKILHNHHPLLYAFLLLIACLICYCVRWCRRNLPRNRDQRGEYQAVGRMLATNFDTDLSEEDMNFYASDEDDDEDNDYMYNNNGYRGGSNTGGMTKRGTIEMGNIGGAVDESNGGLTLEEMNG